MKEQIFNQLKACAAIALACAAFASVWSPGSTCRAQTQTNTSAPAPSPAAQPPPDLPQAVRDVIALARAGLTEDVILAKIRRDGINCNLTTDQIIYLSNEGVSQNVLAALLQTRPGGSPGPAVSALATNASPPLPSQAEPPPLDSTPPGPAPAAPGPVAPPPAMAPSPSVAPSTFAPTPQIPPLAAPQPALVDSFAADPGLNPALWTVRSDLLFRFSAVKGCRLVLPALAFGPGGMQMSGLFGPGQLTGVQSLGGFPAPFTFTTTVVGMSARGVPFEVSLVSADLRQWITIAGHLGGEEPGADLRFGAGVGRVFRGGVAVPLGGPSPSYGVWLNYSGSGLPISSLGYKLYEAPQPGIPYTVQVSVGPDGTASVALLTAAGFSLAARSALPAGSGPFYAILGARDGPAYANWQSVQFTPAAPSPVVATVPAVVPATPTMDYFRDQLTPYGRWVDAPGLGLCWQPSVTGGWRPYYDGGHWVNTDEGWYWQSEYPWGDIAFHYGRWSYSPSYGWLWAPGFEFAPAWVVWRHADDYCGWAPLPPGAVFVDGGWSFRGARVGVDFDFGLSMGFFTFVGYDHFWEHDFRRFVVPRERLVLLYRRSEIVNRFRFDHGRFVNEGIRPERVAELGHRDFRDIRRESARDVKAQEEHRNIEERRADHGLAASGHRPDPIRRVAAPAGKPGSERDQRSATERSGSREEPSRSQSGRGQEEKR